MGYPEESWEEVAKTLGYKSEEDMLQDLYVEQGLSLSQISHVVGYSHLTVRLRLLRLGVVLRKRGGYQKKVRALEKLSDEELFHTHNGLLARRYEVHTSTVSAERRLRRKLAVQDRFAAVEKEVAIHYERHMTLAGSVKELQDQILQLQKDLAFQAGLVQPRPGSSEVGRI